MPYYPEDRDLVQNNLKHILKEKKITMAALSDHLKVTQQQVSKYAAGINAMGINTLLETCKLLDCTPLQIYPQLDLSGNTKLMPTDTDKKGKAINNNIVVENYGFSYHVVNFFKNIVVADFLTLNRKVVLLFVVMMAVFQLILFLYMWPNENIFGSYHPDVRAQMLNTLGLGVDLTLTGLLLPLLIQTPFAYVSLWAGLPTLEWVIYLSIYGTAAEESSLHYWGASIVSLILTLLYAIFIKHLRKKYLKNTGRN
jgi:transcriptional regulator with XRE-family HTH domain